MDKQTAADRLRKQVEACKGLSTTSVSSGEFKKWRRDTEIVIERIFGATGRHLEDYRGVRFTPRVVVSGGADSQYRRAFAGGRTRAIAVLESMIGEIEEFGFQRSEAAIKDPTVRLVRIFDRFHVVVRQLRDRHDGRQTLDVADEYDLQDLLHAILLIEFDDVRSEEWTPSYDTRGIASMRRSSARS